MSNRNVAFAGVISLSLLCGLWIAFRPTTPTLETIQDTDARVSTGASTEPRRPKNDASVVAPIASTRSVQPSALANEYQRRGSFKQFFDINFAQWKQASPETQYYLAKALGDCAQFLGAKFDRFPRPPLLPESEKSRPHFRERRAAADRLAEDCRGFDEISVAPSLRNELMQSSKAGGYPAARAASLLELMGSGMSEIALLEAEKILGGPIDHEVLNGLANYLGSQPEAIRIGDPPMRPRLDMYLEAWKLVMCEYGLDCAADSRGLAFYCVQAGNCGAASYEDYLSRYRFSPNDFTEVLKIRQQLLMGVRQRNLRLLGLSTPRPS